ncbi:hypothetical protein L6R52_38880 [Myxococcota bacterium]|nr:hypothetical protein [Myxococcota bacterium]
MSRAVAIPLSLAWSLAACSPGVGRPAYFPDAEPRDAGFEDARVFPDAEPRDTGVTDGTIVVPDAGPPPAYEFTGVFGILNSSSPLYAREVNGLVSLVVDGYPYVYTGIIDEGGHVEAVSPSLAKQGCNEARITGEYDRASATYELLHETCGSMGQPLSSNITGGFLMDFAPAYSGLYELSVTVPRPDGCWLGPTSGLTVLYAFSFVPNALGGCGNGCALAVFTAEDLIDTPQWYVGNAEGNGAFSASDPDWRVAMNGTFDQATANDPVHFSGLRDAWDPIAGCGFAMQLDGYRIAAP